MKGTYSLLTKSRELSAKHPGSNPLIMRGNIPVLGFGGWGGGGHTGRDKLEP